MNRAEYRILVPVRCGALDDNNMCTFHESGNKPNICKVFDENHKDGFIITEGCILK